ncbi:unnamed protein product [Urochloa decumbens]|uniref:Uncharacterized protein n=1 Tax=Urochloa decumbens TaxID=240449 RepID=A0ABC8ZR38_9POAL
MHGRTTEMYIVYDFDYSTCKLDSQDRTFGSPTKVDHGSGFIMRWAMDAASIVNLFQIYTYLEFFHRCTKEQ